MIEHARVAALYRYPVKGFTAEPCDQLSINEAGRVAGDRVLGFRFADSAVADDAWSAKTSMLVLMNTPGLARLQARFDDSSRHLSLELDGSILADESIDNDSGRLALAAAVQQFALSQDESSLRQASRHLPLRLVGDGLSPRLHDTVAGEVTMHGRASLAALAVLLGDELDELRFRSNIAVEGLEAWRELELSGSKVRIGQMVFKATKTKTRCLAVHANPETGRRDVDILGALTGAMAQEKPTFGVSLKSNGAGLIRIGDEVELL